MFGKGFFRKTWQFVDKFWLSPLPPPSFWEWARSEPSNRLCAMKHTQSRARNRFYETNTVKLSEEPAKKRTENRHTLKQCLCRAVLMTKVHCVHFIVDSSKFSCSFSFLGVWLRAVAKKLTMANNWWQPPLRPDRICEMSRNGVFVSFGEKGVIKTRDTTNTEKATKVWILANARSWR